MGNILAAIDLVHAEHHATILTKAAKLAEIEGLPLSVVTVIPDIGMSIVSSYFDADIEKKMLKRAAEGLHEAVGAVLGTERDTQIQHIVRHGMGAHRPNFQDYLLGQNAASVARHADCSVYILRE